MVSFVLAHSPLTGPASWGRLPAVLRARGQGTVVVDVRDDDEPPFAGRYVARAALQIQDGAPEPPLILVGHSGSGYLLPQLAATQRAAKRAVRGYVFLDAGIPHARSATRLGLMRAEDADFAQELEELLERGQLFPTWTDGDLRDVVSDDALHAELVASLRPRGREFFTEPLPLPPDWPDAPCGYLRTSAAYDAPARLARSRGWPVVERGGGHFAACADPEGVADDLLALVDRL